MEYEVTRELVMLGTLFAVVRLILLESIRWTKRVALIYEKKCICWI
jgi:hypothetical protein